MGKPHIICIQETWLKPQLDFINQGYTAISHDRKVRQGGGVVTFVQNGMKYKVDMVGQDHESIVVFFYPSNSLSSQDLDVVSEQYSVVILIHLMCYGKYKGKWPGY